MKKEFIIGSIFALSLAGCSSSTNANTATIETEPTAQTATVFTGSGNGHNGEVKVEVSFDESGKITDVRIGENAETEQLAKYAFETIPDEIVKEQSFNVDNVSGATFSTNAIKNAVKDAITQAGYKEEDYASKVEHTDAKENEITTDIVVVGAGGAGLSAAYEAASTGAGVTVVESNAYVGGSTLYSGGMVMYAASEEEKEEYNALTEEDLIQALKTYGTEYFNEDLTRDWISHTKENVEWLKENYSGTETILDTHDAGWVPLTKDTEEIDHTLAITMTETEHEEMSDVQAMWITDTLYDLALKANAKFLLSTTADELLIDDKGIVTGIHATSDNGDTYTIHASKVILACGGYGADTELKKKWTETDGPYFGPTSNTGFGVKAGESIGAKTEFAILPDTGGDYGSFVYSTIGGLVINRNTEVLDENDEPIENLYAAGELTCVQSLDPAHFSSGENNGWAIYTGRTAGKNAAESLNQ